ncbi:MAG: MBL fold metallo-hydrolase [Anaerolineaceae bacterium]|nr:MAG: MBL fold metallo-hydrolase [Anaerolineaceae bacterium]
MYQLGDMTLHLINDGITMADPGGPFGLVPRVLYRRYFEPNADFLIPMTLHNLLVESGGQRILIDTGLGDKLTEKDIQRWGLQRPQGTLTDALARLNLTPDDIDIVIDTHLHGDHCAGNTIITAEGVVPAFPNAQYVTQRREYEDAIRPNERTAATYHSVNWDVLMQNGQMRLLDGDTVIAPGITGVVTPGHTPGHMSVKLESDGQHALFVCDMASYAVHFERLAWMTAYDVEPLVTLETKRRWQAWALEHDALLIFPHDPQRPAGRLRQDASSGKMALETVAMPYA